MGKDRIKIVLVLILGLILRFINLNQSFWLDEGAQALMSSKSLLFQWFGRGADFHPPFFYLLIHFWMKLAKSEWFLRLPSVIFGVLTIYLVFRVGEKLFDKKIGLLSALFLAVSPYHIYYSQELRMYSLMAFLGILSTYFLWRRRYFLYLLTTVLLLYTHYFTIFLLIFHFFWIILDIKYFSKIGRRHTEESFSLGKWILVFLGIFLLFSPWVPQLLNQLSAGRYLIETLPAWKSVSNLSPIKAFFLTLVKFSLGRVSFENKIFYLAFSLIILFGLVFILYQGLRKPTKEKIFMGLWFFVPISLSIPISFFVPIYQPFRLLFVLPVFCLLLAIGVFSLRKKYHLIATAMILAFNVFGLYLYYSNSRFQRENWREAVKFIESQDAKNSVAIFEFSEPFAPYQWYSQGKIMAYGVLPGLKAKPEVINQKMPEVTSGVDNVFLFQYLQPLIDAERLVEGWLRKNGFKEKEIKDFSGVGFVYNYVR